MSGNVAVAIVAVFSIAAAGPALAGQTASGASNRRPLAPGDRGYIAEDPALARLVGTRGPSITLQMIDGRTIDVSKRYGQKPVYLKLWATYCIPCRVQMPGLEEIYKKYGDRMEIIAVDAGVGDDTAKVQSFAVKEGMRVPVAIDDGSLGAWLKMEATPFHLLIGRDGRIAYAGHQDGRPLDTAIERVLAAPVAKTRNERTERAERIDTATVKTVAALKPGELVPAIDLRGADKAAVSFSGGATGRPRAVLFTATWCESYLKQTEPESVEACRRVREQVDTLSRAGTVDWLGIVSHLWTTTKDLETYRTKMKPRVPLALDSDGLAFRVFGIRRLPAVALIAPNGRLVRVVGPEDNDLAAAVEKLATAR